eukprot:TRINITY_DN6004_c0_g1_i1.p1 TRINITY_DN6004_c0_g1~~TRINITY_DN6004_c0_g1_i1.p1  ORF type:complete len:390 (+),score=83.85 TRINITY_DN6004_c0_g1_i1:52-1170(+)
MSVLLGALRRCPLHSVQPTLHRAFKNTHLKPHPLLTHRSIHHSPHLHTSSSSLLELVKILRKETQAGISDCREALIESDKDITKAKQWLLQKSKKVAAKKTGRATYEGGIVGHVINNHSEGILLEVNCETDFAARESNFTRVCRDVAQSVMLSTQQPNVSLDVNVVKTLSYVSPDVGGIEVTSIQQAIEALTGILKENIQLRRIIVVRPSDRTCTRVYSYVHSKVDSQQPSIGRIGVLVELHVNTPITSGNMEDTLEKLFNNVCVQIAASKPKYIYSNDSQTTESTSDVSQVEEEDDQEPVLMKQEFIFEDGKSVGEVIRETEKQLNCVLNVKSFYRWEVSEGVERVTSDLAADVQSLLKAADEEKKKIKGN